MNWKRGLTSACVVVGGAVLGTAAVLYGIHLIGAWMIAVVLVAIFAAVWVAEAA